MANPYRTTIAVECKKHGYIQGDHCPICAKEDKNKTEGANIQIFKPMVYDDICETPLLISSKRELKRECNKHGVKACRLM